MLHDYQDNIVTLCGTEKLHAVSLSVSLSVSFCLPTLSPCISPHAEYQTTSTRSFELGGLCECLDSPLLNVLITWSG